MRCARSRELLVVLLTSWALPASAQAQDKAAPAAGAAALDLEQSFSAPESVKPGQPIELKLTVRHPLDAQVVLPEDFGTRWELVDRSETTVNTEAGAETRLGLTFGVYRTGLARLAPMTIKVMLSDGRVEELRTEPVEVKVTSMLGGDADEPKLLESAARYAIFVDDYTVVYALGGAAALLLLLPGFVLLWRRRPKIEPPPPPPAPEDDVALRRLGALAASSMLEQGEYEGFYVEMSETLREYLGRRYSFPGTELTNDEITARLRGVHFKRGIDAGDISDWLEHCDDVKFAGRDIDLKEAEGALRRGFSIVELTRRIGTRDGELPEAEESAPDEATPGVHNDDEVAEEAQAVVVADDVSDEAPSAPKVDLKTKMLLEAARVAGDAGDDDDRPHQQEDDA